jgi:ribosomal-protein-alanine N-acetyltransferase
MISPLTLENLPELQLLIGESGFSNWAPGQWLSLLNGEKLRLSFLAYGHKEPAGFILCQTLLDEAEILDIFVRPEFRKQKIGSRLLQAVFDNRNRVKKIFLEVDVTNSPAISLYGKHGFALQYIRPRYYKNGSDAAVYSWNG